MLPARRALRESSRLKKSPDEKGTLHIEEFGLSIQHCCVPRTHSRPCGCSVTAHRHPHAADSLSTKPSRCIYGSGTSPPLSIQMSGESSIPEEPSRITAAAGGDISGTEEKKQSKSQQLKKIFKEYGAVGVSVHVGISLVSLGMFYMVVSSGLDISAILLKLGFKESLVQSKMAAGTSTFVVAYAIHKLFAPVRISITLVSVPFIVRYFRKVGLFKPPAAKP